MTRYHRATWLDPKVTVKQRRARLLTLFWLSITAVIIAGMTLWFFNTAADSYGLNQSTNLPPCVTEDSDNCFWDAARGNGEGLSFVIIDGIATYSDGTVIDWNEEIR